MAVASHGGRPVSAATWYLYEQGADDWYSHATLMGQVAHLRHDDDLADIDRISQRYRGEPYRRRDEVLVSAEALVERWYTYGDPR